ncbi:MAG: fibronectin type III domain-containing protein [Steroidobacteraceae bacterium]
MGTGRSRIALFAATMLLSSALTGCGFDDDDSSPKTQAAAAVADAPSTAPSPNPTSNPSTPEPTPPSQPTQAPVELPPIVANVIGSATVQWAAPQQKTDGSALQNLAGFTIVYGTSANNLSKSIRVANPSMDQYVVEQLPAGTYYFGVKAYDSAGAESELSNLMTKIIS